MKFLGVDPRRCWNPSKLFQKESEKPVPRPASRDQVIDWFKKTQKPRRVVYQKDNTIYPWFHGKLFFTRFFIEREYVCQRTFHVAAAGILARPQPCPIAS